MSRMNVPPHDRLILAAEDVGFQDMLDGAALRRLREAGWRLAVYDPGGAVRVIAARDGAGHEGIGATIAEAADKCREALTR